jgi:hypothetical protein
MKNLIAITIVGVLAFVLSASAGVPAQWTKWPSDGVYKRKSDCGAQCRRVPMVNGQLLDLSIADLKDVQVDDLSKPLYGPELKASAPYGSLPACQAAIAPYLQDVSVGCTQDIIDTGNHMGSTVCEQQVLPFCYDQEPAAGYALRALCGGDFHAYCIAVAPQSYEQKTVKRLVEDQALKAAHEAAEQAKADAKALLASQVAACKAAMDALDWQSATSAEKWEAVRCMRRMFKRMGR